MKKKIIFHKKTIYILPNLLTSCSLLAGYYSIIYACNKNLVIASILIYLAAMMDFLDGTVARLTNSQSVFGAEYDSLADIVSFGVAPSLIIYFFGSMHHLFNVCFCIVSFIYLVCIGIRLARFNSQIIKHIDTNDYFIGLPCTASASTIAGFVWLCNNNISAYNTIPEKLITLFAIIMTIFLSLMMISNIKFQKYNFIKGKNLLMQIISMGFFIIMIFVYPSVTLFFIFILYIFSGILSNWFIKKHSS